MSNQIKDAWQTEPISRTCEQLKDKSHTPCGLQTTHAYPAMGRGWMALCRGHAINHKEATPIKELLSKGQTLE